MPTIRIETEFLPDGDLLLKVNPASQKELQELRDELNEDGSDRFSSDNTLGDIFENLFGNSDLQWIYPEEIGALTAAPIIGIKELVHGGLLGEEAERIVGAWGFMDYQVRALQDDLLTKGVARLQKGF